LNKISLFDVSPVTYPAYVDSTSGVGSRALELLAEQRGISVTRLDSPEAIRAVIRGEDEATESRLYVPVFTLPTDPVAAFAALTSPLNS
jgi:hypothetical protein